MTIIINDTYKIETDAYNYILYEYRTVKNRRDETKEEKWVSMDKYFNSVHDALVWLAQHKTKEIDYANISEYIKALSSTFKTFECSYTLNS